MEVWVRSCQYVGVHAPASPSSQGPTAPTTGSAPLPVGYGSTLIICRFLLLLGWRQSRSRVQLIINLMINPCLQSAVILAGSNKRCCNWG